MICELLKLRAGQARIQAHLTRQDAVLAEILKNTDLIVKITWAVEIVFRVVDESGKIIERATSMDMKVGQQFQCSVSFKDRFGGVASVDGVPLWSASPDGLLTIEPADDGMSALIKSGMTAGSAQLKCEADADLGAGTTTITGILDVNVLPGEAVLVQLNPGPVEDTPEAPPVP